jgi:hypothetical protein
MKELPDDLHARIVALSTEGDDLVAANQHSLAMLRYRAALDLLPEPRTDWSASTWLHAAIADVQFFAGDFQGCVDTVQFALKFCPGALENPFFHLRAGQGYFEIGDTEAAKQWLASAWMCEGDELLQDEDPKYLGFIREFLRPPAGE